MSTRASSFTFNCPKELPLFVPAVRWGTPHPLYSDFIIYGRGIDIAAAGNVVTVEENNQQIKGTASAKNSNIGIDEQENDYDRFIRAVNNKELAALLTTSPPLDINAIHHTTGQAILHYAASKGLADIASLLLSHGASVDLVDREGESPLWKTCYYGHIDAAKLLANAGADLNLRDKQGWTPLHTAAARAHVGIVLWLLQNTVIDVNTKNNLGSTPLMVAAAKGDVNIIQQLLNYGANPLLHNNLGESAYDIAATCSNVEVAILLESRNNIASESSRLVWYEEKQKHQAGLLGLRWTSPTITNADWIALPEPQDESIGRHQLLKGWFWATDWSIDHTLGELNEGNWIYGNDLSLNENWGAIAPNSIYRKRRRFRIMKKQLAQAPSSLNDDNVSEQTQITCKPEVEPLVMDYISEAERLVQGASIKALGTMSSGKTKSTQDLNVYTQAVEQLLIGIKNETDIAKQKTARQLVSNYLNIAEKHSKMAISSPAVPVLPQPWIPDQAVLACTQCARPFSLFLWRYSCRFCGKIFCNGCSLKCISVHLLKRVEHLAVTSSSNSGNDGDNILPTSVPSLPIQTKRTTNLRVCDTCHKFLTHPPSSTVSSTAGSIRRSPLVSPEQSDIPSKITTTDTDNDDNKDQENATITEVFMHTQEGSGLDLSVDQQQQPFLERRSSGNSTSSLDECPFCLTMFLPNLDTPEREQHMLECANSNETPFNTKQRVRYVVQTMTEDTVAECSICFENFLKGQEVARLSCLCTFHADCVRRWFAKHEFSECPFHTIT